MSRQIFISFCDWMQRQYQSIWSYNKPHKNFFMTVKAIMNISPYLASYPIYRAHLGFFWLCWETYRILVPWAGIEPGPLQWKCQVLTNHWTAIIIIIIIYLLKKIIYFWLLWVFVAAGGLSLVAVSGGYSSSQCLGISLLWLLLLWSRGSTHAGFSSCGTRA